MKLADQITSLKQLAAEQSDVAGLYIAAFLQAFANGIWLVAMPFIIKRLSGTDFEVGLCIGGYFVGYVASLLFSRPLLDRFDLRRSTLLGAGSMTAGMAVTCLTVVTAQKGLCPGSVILLLTIISAAMGVMTVVLWPQVVGWLSVNHEGSRLNRRLGIFNISWSLAGIVGPYVGGYLVETSSTSPLIAATVIMVVSFWAVTLAKRPQNHPAAAQHSQAPAQEAQELLHWRFTWMARIALLTSFVCIGLVRTQLPLLFKFNLGFSELDFGMAVVVMNAIIFVVFLAAAKTHAWHYVLSIFMGTQAALLLSMLLILRGSGMWVLFLSVGLIGAGQAFLYASHLYYAISGAPNRSAKMAIHETTLSLGMIIGSLFGGFLSDHFTRYTPYWFGFAIVLAGLAAQSAIFFFPAFLKNNQT